MNIIAHAEGYFFKAKASIAWDRDPLVAKRFLRKATKKFQEVCCFVAKIPSDNMPTPSETIQALDTDPNNSDTLCNIAEISERLLEGESRGLSHIKFSLKDRQVLETEGFARSLEIIVSEPHTRTNSTQHQTQAII